MIGFVLDASVTMAWCFEDEATPETWSVLDRLASEGAIVPALWPLEVGNILTQAERRQRTTAARISQFVEQLGPCPSVLTMRQLPMPSARPFPSRGPTTDHL